MDEEDTNRLIRDADRTDINCIVLRICYGVRRSYDLVRESGTLKSTSHYQDKSHVPGKRTIENFQQLQINGAVVGFPECPGGVPSKFHLNPSMGF